VKRSEIAIFHGFWLALVALLLSGCDNELLSRIDRLEAQAEQNERDGLQFLARNAQQSGVQLRPSGLQYRVLKSGSGASPQAGDLVQVHYRGSLIDGSEFDSSYARGEPASFALRGLIPGWQEALPLMRVGGHWRLFVPAQLAYGKRSPSSKIPPNSTLIFELELLAIEGQH
jgi:FKBP-type peptidyl-prolyl cis-trans isomerase